MLDYLKKYTAQYPYLVRIGVPITIGQLGVIVLRVDLTSRRCFGDEGGIAIEVDHYPVLVGTQEASFCTISAHRSISSLGLCVAQEV